MLDQRCMKNKSTLAVILGIGLLLVLFWQFWEQAHGWNHSLLGKHAFRQSQTAVAAANFVEDGFALHPTIPVYGPPWILPLELPLYQWIHAGVVRLLSTPLVQSGRGLSILFHLIGLIQLFRILRLLKVGMPSALFALMVILVSPVSVYWSQAILIQSLAVALVLSYVLSGLQSISSSPSRWKLLETVLLGTLAAMVKITAFSVGWGFLALHIATKAFIDSQPKKPFPGKDVFRTFLLLLIPIVVGAVWVLYSGLIARMNSIPDAAHSSIWYFGSVSARFDPEQLSVIWKHCVEWTLGSPLALVVILFSLLAPWPKRVRSWAFLLAAVAGPLVFWNVYFVHDYYSYEIVFWFGAGIALCFDAPELWKTKLRSLGSLACMTIILSLMIQGYYRTPYPWFLRHDYRVQEYEYLNAVGESVDRNTFFLVLGDDWNPVTAFCTGRKTIMMRSDGVENGIYPLIYEKAVAEGLRCGGLLYYTRGADTEMLAKVLDQFSLKPEPSSSLGEYLLFFRMGNEA